MHVKFHSNAGDVDFEPPVMHITSKIRHAKPIQRADFEFLKSVTKCTPKVTIPSPTMLHFRGGRAAISKEAYPDLEDAAAKFMPLDQMCLSPQCGFSSTVHGNQIAVEAQAAKLRLVVETAHEVWGTA
jgi:methionine synthase II (cobalamin-independent)